MSEQEDQDWLSAAQSAIAEDGHISTPDFSRVTLFTGWALANGYAVTVSHHEPVTHDVSSDYFITVDKEDPQNPA